MQPGCLPASLRRMSDHFTVTALHLGWTNAAFSLWRSSREDLQRLQIYSKCICCILLTWAGMSSFISITDITGMIFSSKEPAELDTVTASVQEHWVLPLTVHKHHFNTRSTRITEKIMGVLSCIWVAGLVDIRAKRQEWFGWEGTLETISIPPAMDRDIFN